MQGHDCLPQRSPPVDSVPTRDEPSERLLLDGLDLPAQRGERGAPQPAQHIGIAPLALASARPQLAANEQLVALERSEQVADVAPEARVGVRGRERTSSPRIAQHELTERLGPALEERIRESGRRHRAQRVAVAARVLDRDQPLIAHDPDAHGAPLRLEDSRMRLVELADTQVAP